MISVSQHCIQSLIGQLVVALQCAQVLQCFGWQVVSLALFVCADPAHPMRDVSLVVAAWRSFGGVLNMLSGCRVQQHGCLDTAA